MNTKWLCGYALFISLFLIAVPLMASTTWQQTSGPGGGDIRALAMDPTSSQTLYAGTTGGGVFKSTNGGVSWNVVNSGLTNMDVRSLVIDPSSTQTIYAGTYGGVFKSTNGGSSWSAVNNGLTSTIVIPLAIDPSSSQTVYAGTNGGMFKSTNGGASWSAINSGLGITLIWSLAIDPGNAQTVYAGTDGGGIFKSINGGVSWSKLNSGLTNANVYSLAIDPTSSQTIYAGTWYDGVFKSIDGGDSWSAVNSGVSGTGVLSLAIDPNSSQTVYAGIYQGSVYRSTNGGGSWSALDSGLGAASIWSLAIDPGSSQTIYAGTDGWGVFRSADGGGTWISANSGLLHADVTALAIDPGSSQTIYAGTGGGVVFKSVNGGGTWGPLSNGLIGPGMVRSLAIDPGSSQTIYAGVGGGVFKSINGGDSWNAVNSGFPVSTMVRSLVIDPGSSQTIYAGIEGGVFKSINGGGSWSAANSGLADGTVVNCLALEPGSSQTIYAGTAAGGIFKSTDGGGSWIAQNSGLTGMVVLFLAIDPTSTQTIYAGIYDGGVFKSTDGGGSWVAQNSGLTDKDVRALAIDPTNSQIIYAGTYSSGVYASANGGNSWSTLKSGLTNLSVYSLAIDPTSSQIIYAGTYEGVFKGDANALTISGIPNPSATVDTPYSFIPDSTKATGFSIAGTVPPGLHFDAETGALSGIPTTFGIYDTIVISATNATGTTSLPAFSITVALPMPTISGTPVTSAKESIDYTFTPTATYAASFSISNMPSWAGFNTTTGVLSGTPAQADIGAYSNIIISVTNSTGTVSLPPFAITVVELPQPTISGTPAASVIAGNAYTFAPTTTDAASFSITNMPSWASFNATTGVLGGTPANTDAMSYGNIVISAVNTKGTASLPAFTVTVIADKKAPTITTFSIPENLNSLIIPVTLTASDNGEMIFYLVNESSSKPAAGAAGWSATVPVTYTSTKTGTRTLYAWAKDGVGNVSSSRSDKVNIDLTPPALTIKSVLTTNLPAITVSGTKEAGSILSVTPLAGIAFTFSKATTNPSATWSCTATGYGAGDTSISFIATDKAGNTTTKTAVITYDTVAPTGTIHIKGTEPTDTYTNKTPVPLQLTCNGTGSAPAFMQFSNDTKTWSAWRAYKTTDSWTLSSNNGTKTVSVRFKDAAGNISEPVSATIILDTIKPTGSVSISGTEPTNAYTKSTTVTLAIKADDALSGVSKMQVSESSTFVGASWEDVKESRDYTFAKVTNGKKTIYVRFADLAGNVSVTASDSVTLDTAGPNLTITPVLPTNQPALTISGIKEAGSTITAVPLDGITFTFSKATTNPSATWSCTVTGYGAGDTTISFIATDKAGNPTTKSAVITSDVVAPTGTILIKGTEASDTYTTKTAVPLQLTCNGTGTDPAFMRFSMDNKTWSAWEPYKTTKTHTLGTLVGTQTVYAQFKDAAGNTNDPNSPISDNIIYDPNKPTGKLLIKGSEATDTYTNSTSVTVAISAFDDAKNAPADSWSGVTQMQVSGTSAFTNAVWEEYATSRDYTFGSATNGTKAVYVRFRDAAGNISATYGDSIVLDSVAPSLTIASPLDTTTTLRSQTITGTKAANSRIDVSASTAALVNSIVAPLASTTWSCVVGAFSEGGNTFTIAATDSAENVTSREVSVTYRAFKQADLAGTWDLVGGGASSTQGSVVRGTLVIDESGAVTGGTFATNESPQTVTGGYLTLSEEGQINGTVNVGQYSTISISNAAMHNGRQVVSFANSTTSGDFQLGIAFKEGGSYASGDLSGDWYLYGAMNGLLNGNDAAGIVQGSVTVDATGKVIKGKFTDSSGTFTINGGYLGGDSHGAITGSFNGYVNQFPKEIVSTNLSQGTMSQSKTLLQYSGSMDVQSAGTLYHSFVGIKGGGAFSTADMAGTWDFTSILGETGNGDGVAYGTISVDKAGKVTGGSATTLSGDASVVTGGVIAIGSSGLISGTITYVTGAVSTSVTIQSGKMDSSKTEFISCNRFSSKYGLILASKRL